MNNCRSIQDYSQTNLTFLKSFHQVLGPKSFERKTNRYAGQSYDTIRTSMSGSGDGSFPPKDALLSTSTIKGSSPFTTAIGDLSNCRYCKNISLETLSQPGGYRHASSRSSLVRSAQKCKLCSLIFRRDRTKNLNDPLYLSLHAVDADETQQICLKISHGKVRDSEENDIIFFLYTFPG